MLNYPLWLNSIFVQMKKKKKKKIIKPFREYFLNVGMVYIVYNPLFHTLFQRRKFDPVTQYKMFKLPQ